jgi:hypothetical protein
LFCWYQVSYANPSELITNPFHDQQLCCNKTLWTLACHETQNHLVEFWASTILTTLGSILLLSTIIVESSSTKDFQILLALVCTFFQSTDAPYLDHSIHRTLSVHWSLLDYSLVKRYVMISLRVIGILMSEFSTVEISLKILSEITKVW